jgi:hypothetical protein
MEPVDIFRDRGIRGNIFVLFFSPTGREIQKEATVDPGDS